MELTKLPQIHRMSFGNKFKNYWRPLINRDFFLGRDPFEDARMTEKISRFPLNILEHKEYYKIEIPLSGFEKNQIKVYLDNDILTINAEKDVNKNLNSNYVIKEHDVDRFEHSFQLGKLTDQNNISATFKNGMLEVRLYHILETPLIEKSKKINIE